VSLQGFSIQGTFCSSGRATLSRAWPDKITNGNPFFAKGIDQFRAETALEGQVNNSRVGSRRPQRRQGFLLSADRPYDAEPRHGEPCIRRPDGRTPNAVARRSARFFDAAVPVNCSLTLTSEGGLKWIGGSEWSQPMYSKSNMSVVQPEPITKSLEEISNIVCDDGPVNHLGLKPQPDAVEDVNKSIGELINKVSATSIAEVEKVISNLEAVRNYLKSEGDRIQQEMARYAHLTDTASASAKIIVESLGQWRKEPTMITTDNVNLKAKRA
jgi:hypothetical protein